MLTLGSDVAIISETWYNKKHSNEITQLPGCICYRRDRVKRYAGGVAVFIRDYVDSCIYKPVINAVKGDENFEILWVKTFINDRECFIGALYHPPKPVYVTSDFLIYLERSLEAISISSLNPYIILAGDFNQIDDNSITDMGLFLSHERLLTHCGHPLDKIFVSESMYTNVKTVKSAINTKHDAVVARSDNSFIVDSNKVHNKCSFRKPTPAQNAAFLSALKSFDWSPVTSADMIQVAADKFYDCCTMLLNKFYATKSATITSRDPPYVTFFYLKFNEKEKLINESW